MDYRSNQGSVSRLEWHAPDRRNRHAPDQKPEWSSETDSPDSTPPGRALRSMQTGQNCIAPENSLPQLGQVRLRSVLMGLDVLRMRSRLRNEHGFLRQPAAARLRNQVLGSVPPAIPSSTERCEIRRRTLLASCGPASIVTSRRSNARVSQALRVWNKPFLRNNSAFVRAT